MNDHFAEMSVKWLFFVIDMTAREHHSNSDGATIFPEGEGFMPFRISCRIKTFLMRLIFRCRNGKVWGKEGFGMNIIYTHNKYLTPAPRAAAWLRRAFLAWLVAAAAEYLLLPQELRALSELDGLAQMSALRMVAVGAAVFGVSTLLGKIVPAAAERWLIFAAAAVLSGAALAASFHWAFAAACVLVLAVLALYALCGWEGSGFARGTRCAEQKWCAWALGGAALAFFALVSLWTVARVYSFSTPTYDFGIFAQMFHSMKTTLAPITTVERDGALSHFAVHVSPIYYLLLPFYCLVPIPATLQVLQAAVLASAVIPLRKLSKHHGLKPPVWLLLGAVLLAYPAYAGGTSYDIHENAFLTPLLLWLLYGLDRRNLPLTALAGLLTLGVKEDAAVYVAVVALYVLLRGLLSREGKWELVTGSALLAGAVGYFLAVTAYLASFGDGVMTYRYNNFMFDGSGSLVTVIKAVLISPMKAVFECVDSEKLEFIALTLLPLAGLPLLTRRYERYVLLIPYILVNLMSDYQYQHDIFFQYTYGSTACLIYLTLVNAADIRATKRQIAAMGAAFAIGLACFWAQIMPKVTHYSGYLVTYADYYDALREVLDTVPDDASVAATTFYTTHLSQRDTLYDVKYASMEHILSCEYVVLGVTDNNSLKKFAKGEASGYEVFSEYLTAQGYEKQAQYDGRLEIYRRK